MFLVTKVTQNVIWKSENHIVNLLKTPSYYEPESNITQPNTKKFHLNKFLNNKQMNRTKQNFRTQTPTWLRVLCLTLLASWMGFQSFINMGVNLGALPTKGLTLPLMSYGGSAILVNLVAIAVVLKVDRENRTLMQGGRV